MSRTIDISKIKEKIAALTERGGNNQKRQGNIEFWLAGPGDYTVRCLHWPQGICKDGEFFIDRYFYKNVAGRKKILAPEQFDKPDPIRDLRMKLFASGTADDKNLAKKLFARMTSYVPVVVLSGPNADPTKVLLWAFGSDIYKKLLNYFMNEKVGDYFDPKTGFNLTVKVEKQGEYMRQTPELDALTGRCPIADSDEKIEALLKNIPDVSGLWKLQTYEEIQRDLNAWLNGNVAVDVKNDTTGTEKTPEKVTVDELDQLVKETKKPKVAATPKASKKDPVVETPSDDGEDMLDKAFQDLMEDD